MDTEKLLKLISMDAELRDIPLVYIFRVMNKIMELLPACMRKDDYDV